VILRQVKEAELFDVGGAGLLLLALCCSFAACGGAKPTQIVSDAAVAALLWRPPEAVLEKDHALPVAVNNGRSIYVDDSAAVVFSISIPCGDLAKQVTGHSRYAGKKPQRVAGRRLRGAGH